MLLESFDFILFLICDFLSVYFLGLLVVEIGGVEVELVLFLYLCFFYNLVQSLKLKIFM